MQQRRLGKLDYVFEEKMIVRLSSPKYWGLPLAITLLGLVFAFLVVKSDFLYPLLTSVTMFWFAMIATAGAVGDHRREISVKSILLNKE